MKKVFHSSLEGAQHGPKGLIGFLTFAKNSGADGAQPSNFMVNKGNGFMTAAEIKQAFAGAILKLDGLSCHCPFWVHGAAASAMMLGGPITRSVRPFIPKEVAAHGNIKILQWAEDYILGFLDLCAELGIKIVPMFWGPYGDPALYTGYPWGFWSGDGFDMVKEFQEQFVKMTRTIRNRARTLGIVLAHKIHPGTAACCAENFNALVKICGDDICLGVNADLSHCWEGEDWETRFRKVGDRVYGCHVKDHTIVRGRPFRSMEPDWQKRGMQFTSLGGGDLGLIRYAELMIEIGYPQRYCELMGTETAPLVVEAESAFRDGDATSAAGIAYVAEHLCFAVAQGSFEDAMGEKKAEPAPVNKKKETVRLSLPPKPAPTSALPPPLVIEPAALPLTPVTAELAIREIPPADLAEMEDGCPAPAAPSETPRAAQAEDILTAAATTVNLAQPGRAAD